MRFVRSISLLLAAAGCGSLLACGPVHSVTIGQGGPAGPPVVHDGPGGGPPPWAPAHGYRRKHQRAYHGHSGTVDLVFDSGLGVYVVVGIPNYYYWDGVYLRLSAGQWLRAPYLDAPWAPCPPDRLPGKLRDKPIKAQKGPAKAQGKDKSKGKGKGRSK